MKLLAGRFVQAAAVLGLVAGAAGQARSEPSSLTLLALGAVGFVAHGSRRRKPGRVIGPLAMMAILAFGVQNAHAQSSWNGGTGNWNVSTNWTPSGVPNSSSTDVSIAGTSVNLSSVTIDNISPSVHNLSLDQYSTLSIQGTQNLNVYGSSIANAGQIQAGNNSDLFLIGSGATFNLTGAGTVSLGAANTVLEGFFGNENLVNQVNTIGGQGSIKSLGSFQNQGTVNANVAGGTLLINEVPTTNTGTLQATGGGTLYINASTVNNTGGTISAGSSSLVTFYGATINGGNLSSVGSGVIQGLFTDTLNGVTITPGSTYLLNNNVTYLTGDLTNKGTIIVGNSTNSSNLQPDINNGTINLSGGGTINLNNAGSILGGFNGNETLVNHDNLIEGQGSIKSLNSFNNQATVNANVSGGTLEITTISNVANTGTLQATGGGTLYINASTVNNTGGTISTDSSSSVVLNDSTVNGGNLSAAAGAVIHATFLNWLNGVTITPGSTYSLDNSVTYLTGDLTNKGTIIVGNSSNSSNLQPDINNGTINLSGGGTITLNNAGSFLSGFNGNETLVNRDNLIQGQGFIRDLASFQNQGTVLANVLGGTLAITNAPTTNSGTFQVNGGSTLQVNGSFSTSGTVNIGAVGDTSASLFQVTGLHDYVQNSGITSLWSAHSTLAVAANQSVNIEGGLLQGFGTVQGNLINSGTVHPGDGPGLLSVTGNYTQNAGGLLDIAIGGRTAGSEYSVLSVSGLASLSGMLDVSLVNGFSPVTGDLFVILTSGGLSGEFTDSTIQLGNITFTVEYSPTGYANDVVLETQVAPPAVPEPASWLIFGAGAAAMGTCVVRRSKSQVREG
jgi:hypothetical protein